MNVVVVLPPRLAMPDTPSFLRRGARCSEGHLRCQDVFSYRQSSAQKVSHFIICLELGFCLTRFCWSWLTAPSPWERAGERIYNNSLNILLLTCNVYICLIHSVSPNEYKILYCNNFCITFCIFLRSHKAPEVSPGEWDCGRQHHLCRTYPEAI